MARKKTIIAACLGVFTGAIVTFFLTSSLKKPQYYNLLINNIL